MEKAIADAPSSVILHDRDGEPSATLEGDRVHFVPASSALRILDRKTQEQREPKTPDFVEYVKLADGLKNIAYLSTAFIPKDIPQDIADAWRLYLVLSHSKRPDRLRRLHLVWRAAHGRDHGEVPRRARTTW